MNKRKLVWGTLGIMLPASLVACGQRTGELGPTGSLPSLLSRSAGHVPSGRSANLTVRPRVFASAYSIQSSVAYTRADINHLTIEVLRVLPDLSTSLEASVDLLASQLDSPVTFSSLAAQTTYRIKLTAYATADFTQPISDDILSTTDVAVGNDENVSVSLTVRLLGADFSGSGSGSITIVDGEYSDPGDASISVATPTPTPQLAATFGTSGELSTVATLVSIADAAAGTYLLSIDKRFDAGAGVDAYYLRWGTMWSDQNEVYLGTAWPPSQTSITGPSGAGTLTVAFQGTAPTVFPVSDSVNVALQ